MLKQEHNPYTQLIFIRSLEYFLFLSLLRKREHLKRCFLFKELFGSYTLWPRRCKATDHRDGVFCSSGFGGCNPGCVWGVRKESQDRGKRRVQAESSRSLELKIIKKATLFNGFLTFILRRKKTRESF